MVGPFPVKKEVQYKHLLVCVDPVSRLLLGFPMIDTSAEAIADVFLRKVCLKYGFPVSILSDQGNNFI
eukprot:Awhi_evm1s1950